MQITNFDTRRRFSIVPRALLALLVSACGASGQALDESAAPRVERVSARVFDDDAAATDCAAKSRTLWLLLHGPDRIELVDVATGARVSEAALDAALPRYPGVAGITSPCSDTPELVFVDRHPRERDAALYRHVVRLVSSAGHVRTGPSVYDARGNVLQQLLFEGPRGPALVLALADKASVRVVVLDLATGRELADFAEPQPDSSFARDIALLGDCDGDGVRDVAITAPWTRVGAGHTGSVHIYSGRTSRQLRAITALDIPAAERADDFGTHVGRIGDLDADGVDDVAVTAENELRGQRDSAHSSAYPTVFLWSGRDGRYLGAVPLPEREQMPIGFGDSLGDAGDVDADGVSDVAIGHSRSFDAQERSVGCVLVVSGRTRAILSMSWGDTNELDFGRFAAHFADRALLVTGTVREYVCLSLRGREPTVAWRRPRAR